MTFLNKLSLLITLSLIACGGANFSFKPTEAPQNVKTIAILQHYNESANGPSNISQLFTEKLRDYFQNNTKLTLSNSPESADLVLEGSIIRYDIAPAAPTSNGITETAAQQKITIGVQTSYTNHVDTSASFDATFDGFDFFNGDQNLADVETDKIDIISEQIIIKIFTKSFDTW